MQVCCSSVTIDSEVWDPWISAQTPTTTFPMTPPRTYLEYYRLQNKPKGYFCPVNYVYTDYLCFDQITKNIYMVIHISINH